MKKATLLAVESSCDETAVAVFRGCELLASEVASQIDLHQSTGGVVPEVASREHLRVLRPLLQQALEKAELAVEEIDLFAATHGPGLASSLMIGAALAKGLAVGAGKPFLAVNHLEAHLLSPFFEAPERIGPAVGLVVSGGHTLLVRIERLGGYRLLGQTRDDAAGEAFDKIGKLLGLPYPGGPNLDRRAREGARDRFRFPRSMLDSGDFNFSFSGLKTSLRYLLPTLADPPVADLCASVQEAIVDVLVEKTVAAARSEGLRVLAISGGVSCNSRLRERFAEAAEKGGMELRTAAPWLCTDNAAMIGFVAALRHADGESSALSTDIDPNLRLATF